MNNKYIYFFYYGSIAILAYLYITRNSGYAVDDSFITYRYAYNLKEGLGLTFNPGEYYYGTTAAGYAITLALICGVIDFIASILKPNDITAFDIPFIATALSCGAITLVAAYLPRLTTPNRGILLWITCLLCACFLFTAIPFNEVSGHETYIYLALAFTGIMVIAYSNDAALSALILAFSVTIRPDTVLFGLIVPLLEWHRSELTLRGFLRRPNTIRFFSLYATSIIAWAVFLFFYFGTFVPGTMAAKKVQATMGYWPIYSINSLATYISSSLGNRASILIGVGTIVWTLLFITKIFKRTRIQPSDIVAASWMIFGLTSALTYITLNVTFWPWYGVPLAFSFMVVSFVGWISIVKFATSPAAQTSTTNKRLSILTRLASLIFLASFVDTPSKLEAWAQSKNTNEHIYAYSEIIDYIKKSSPNGAKVQLAEPGSLGYHLGPKYFVIDELGLATPGEAAALAAKDYSWTIHKWKPDYLVCSFRGVYSACEQNLQQGGYTLIGEFNTSFWKQFGGHGAQLYKRIIESN